VSDKAQPNRPRWWGLGMMPRGEWTDLSGAWAQRWRLLTPSLEAAVAADGDSGTTDSWRRFCFRAVLSRKTIAGNNLPGRPFKAGAELRQALRDKPPGEWWLPPGLAFILLNLACRATPAPLSL